MNVQTVKDRLRDSREALFDAYGIERMAVFGSVARGEATDVSDIDLLVEFNQPIGLRFVDLAELLETILDSPVDLVSKGGIKPKYWNSIESELVYV